MSQLWSMKHSIFFVETLHFNNLLDGRRMEEEEEEPSCLSSLWVMTLTWVSLHLCIFSSRAQPRFVITHHHTFSKAKLFFRVYAGILRVDPTCCSWFCQINTEWRPEYSQQQKHYSKVMEMMNLLVNFELTWRVNEASHERSNTLDLVLSTGLNTDNDSVLHESVSDRHFVPLDVEIIFPKRKREVWMKKRFFRLKLDSAI